jgi:hypothetical protein
MSKSAYLKFKKGEQLSRKQAMAAQCYKCNGYDVESSHDCLGVTCPLYPWSPWGKSHGLRPAKCSKNNLKPKDKPFPKSKSIKTEKEAQKRVEGKEG